ncbi:hypothetical protein GCM10022393_25660 [Aquimarina addita]|uniref:cellulase n=1 Tax=Aquimarina addita TaxID=870485 RepID=A0ABP6UP01_9FLAO
MKISLTLFLALLTFPFVKAQNSDINYLNKTYAYGTMPNNVGSTDMQNAYTTWKSTFVDTNCSNGSARVKFDQPEFTVSEGIAYGMLLSAYANDKELFDGLWLYYQTNSNGNGVMNWKIQGCNTVNGQNGATDAEIDVAIALIIAGNRFGNDDTYDYHTDAKQLIAAIKQHEVESGSYVLKPGDAWGGSQNTNPSYFAPGYFRVYGEFTNDQAFWNNVADKSYEILNANLSVNNAVDCLVSDWCKANGTYSDIVDWAYESGQTFYYDAARTPWRIATDYVWYGDSDAASYTTKCRNFVNSKGGIAQIKAGYKQDGTVIGNYQDPVFTGSFASSILSSTNQNEVNTAYTTLKNQTSTAYFAATLRVLYMYTMSGNLYNPLTDTNNPTIPTTTVVHMKKRNASTFAIDGNWGGSNRQNIFLWSANTNNVNQQWNEIDRGNGYYSYQKSGTNHCIDGNNGGANGQNVYLWDCGENNYNQHWRKVDVGGGSYRLEKRNSPGYSLDGGRNGVDGQNLYLWTSNNANQNQHWTFSTVAESKGNNSTTQQEFTTYPNPVSNVLNINIPDSKSAKVDIINVTGQIIQTENIQGGTASVNVEQLSKGIYLVKITDELQVYAPLKIVKE